MGKIYSSASEVLVWLDLLRSRTDNLVWAVTEFGPRLKWMIKTNHPSLVVGNIDHHDFRRAISITDLISRFIRVAIFYKSCRWFSRAWVFQDVILAQRTRVFCGPYELAWDKMTDLARGFCQFRVCSVDQCPN